MGINVSLKLVGESDIKYLHEWFNSEGAFGEFDQPTPHTYEQIAEKWQRGHYVSSLRIIVKDQRPVGFTDYTIDRMAPWIASICVIVALPEERRQGVGTKAHQLLIKQVFQLNPQVQKIEALTDIENQAEQRVLEKSGFQKEGVFRRKYQLRGQIRDMVSYGLLRESL